MEELDEELMDREESEELRVALEKLAACERAWESQRSREREQELREARKKVSKIGGKTGSSKREQPEEKKVITRKKLKYSLMEDTWGEEQPEPEEPPTTSASSSINNLELPIPPTLSRSSCDGLKSSQEPPTSLGSAKTPTKNIGVPKCATAAGAGRQDYGN